MRYRVTFLDGIDLLVTADSEVEAVKVASGLKKKLKQGKRNTVDNKK